MYKIVGERYPGSERIAVGGFMFLRFLCPAIATPEAFGVVGGMSLYSSLRNWGIYLQTSWCSDQRVPSWACAGYQTLATSGKWNDQFPWGIHEWIGSICSRARQNNWRPLRQLCSMLFSQNFDCTCTNPHFKIIPPDSPPGKSVHISSEQQEEDLVNLHHHISMNHEKIGKILENQQSRETAEKYGFIYLCYTHHTDLFVDWQAYYKNLDPLLSRLRRPPLNQSVHTVEVVQRIAIYMMSLCVPIPIRTRILSNRRRLCSFMAFPRRNSQWYILLLRESTPPSIWTCCYFTFLGYFSYLLITFIDANVILPRHYKKFTTSPLCWLLIVPSLAQSIKLPFPGLLSMSVTSQMQQART